jgi:hypothetical protein
MSMDEHGCRRVSKSEPHGFISIETIQLFTLSQKPLRKSKEQYNAQLFDVRTIEVPNYLTSVINRDAIIEQITSVLTNRKQFVLCSLSKKTRIVYTYKFMWSTGEHR